MAIVAFTVVMFFIGCANVSTPLGGPYDTVPPRVLFLEPGYGATNFDKKRITMTFDEYILLQNQQTEFYTSPMMDKNPTLTIRGKSLQIDLVSPLDSNTTYSLNFGRTIADNNEGNALTGFRYVFSTGDAVDSLLMSGYAVDAYTADTIGNVFIYFFDDATADSLMRLKPWDTVTMVAMDSNYLDSLGLSPTLDSDSAIDTLKVEALVDTLNMISMDSTAVDSLATMQLIDTVSKQELIELDSILYKVKPNAIARTVTNGTFIAENLAGKNYRIYAFLDNNSNKTYDPGVDLVAFNDSIYNPLEMPPFEIWYDTIQHRLHAQPQIYLRMFKETVINRRANLGSISRPEKQRLYVTFTGSYPLIESIEFDSIPADSIITEYLTKGKDTISLWLNKIPENLPDSIAGRLIYQKYDSVNMLQLDTVRFNLGWFKALSKEEIREQRALQRPERGSRRRAAKGAEGDNNDQRPEGAPQDREDENPDRPEEDALDQQSDNEVDLNEDENQNEDEGQNEEIDENEDVDEGEQEEDSNKTSKEEEEEEEQKLVINVKTSSSKHNADKDLEVPFTMPLRDIDTSGMTLFLQPIKEDELPQQVDMTFEQDTADIKKWWIRSDLKIDEKYTLTIPQGALRDISGVTNDSLKFDFSTDSPEKYATFILNVNNADPDKYYIVQIIKDKKVINEKIDVTAGQTKIQYISPAEVSIRVIEDSNKNGVWDSGDLRHRRQPELMATYYDSNKNDKITAKLNWELEFDIDMEQLFAPTTMEELQDRIQRMEIEAQKRRNEQKLQQQNKK